MWSQASSKHYGEFFVASQSSQCAPQWVNKLFTQKDEIAGSPKSTRVEAQFSTCAWGHQLKPRAEKIFALGHIAGGLNHLKKNLLLSFCKWIVWEYQESVTTCQSSVPMATLDHWHYGHCIEWKVQSKISQAFESHHQLVKWRYKYITSIQFYISNQNDSWNQIK